MKKVLGVVASEGLAVGKAYVLPDKNELLLIAYQISDEDLPLHEKRLDDALVLARNKLSSTIQKIKGQEASIDILKTHLSMLNDSAFIDEIKADLRANKMNVEYTLKKKVDDVANALNAQDDVYMQARAVDIQDAFDTVLYNLVNSDGMHKNRFEHIPPNVILFAKEIKPSEAILLKSVGIAGLVTEEGSRTSHIAIMARSWGIPMLVGVKNCLTLLGLTDELVILDCDESCLYFGASDAEVQKFTEIIKEKRLLEESLFVADSNGKDICKTKDNIIINLAANIALPDEVQDKKLIYASEIGLFRTEFLILDREALPSEDEQFSIYSNLVKSIEKKPVIIRTFDVGADKMIGEQEALGEKNPMLGWRGIRYSISKQSLFKTQIKAILRAAFFGEIKILIPMISTIEEILQAKKIIEQAKSELEVTNTEFNENVALGIMVEVPSVAIMAEAFAPYVDFMSIGTNDLTQYVMAADRENVKVAKLASYFNPSVLHLIQNIINAKSKISSEIPNNLKISMCGEMASDELAVCILFAMGLRSFSMQMRKLPRIKKLLEKISLKEAKNILYKIKPLVSSEKIRECIFTELKKLNYI